MYNNIHFKTDKQMSRHAHARQQQRGVSDFIIDLLMEFGTDRDAGDGTKSVWANKRTLKEIKSYVGNATFSSVESQLKRVYLVVNAERVVTVAYAH